LISHKPCFYSFVLDNFELYLVPMMNPGGRVFLEQKDEFCHRNNFRGVDLNRNADWAYNGPGSSKVPGHEEYYFFNLARIDRLFEADECSNCVRNNGEHAWSEPESQFFRDLALANKYLAYLSIHSGEQQIFSAFVDSFSKKNKRLRPNTTSELAMIKQMQDNSAGFYSRSGVGWKMNSYSADGTLYDWIAGVVEVPYSICGEVWGRPYHPDCFNMFNPKSENLLADLRKIRPIYTQFFIYLAEKHLGNKYVLPPASSSLQFESFRALCENEKRLESRLLRQNLLN